MDASFPRLRVGLTNHMKARPVNDGPLRRFVALGKELARDASGALGHVGGSSGCEHVSPRRPRIRPQVDDPIRRRDQIEMMLDHQQRVARVHQAAQHTQQVGHVREVQPRGRLVEQEQRSSRCRASQLGGQLDALGLAAGECVRWLTQAAR